MLVLSCTDNSQQQLYRETFYSILSRPSNLIDVLYFKKNNKRTKNPVNCFLHDDASVGMRSSQTSIVIKTCQTPFPVLDTTDPFLFLTFRMTWISQHFSSIPTLGVSKTNSFSGIIPKFGTQMQKLLGYPEVLKKWHIDEYSMMSHRQANAKLEYNGVFRAQLCMITDSRSVK